MIGLLELLSYDYWATLLYAIDPYPTAAKSHSLLNHLPDRVWKGLRRRQHEHVGSKDSVHITRKILKSRN
jgi:hypothetical protein